MSLTLLQAQPGEATGRAAHDHLRSGQGGTAVVRHAAMHAKYRSVKHRPETIKKGPEDEPRVWEACI
jgi:hypothetical protein